MASPPASNDPPESDEIEVTLLGRGHGECCLVHLGNDDWMVVDSFYQPEESTTMNAAGQRTEHEKVPAAILYLDDLYEDSGRVPEVKLIVLTHFHTDHYEGILELHERYTRAYLAIPVAVQAATFPLVFSKRSTDSLQKVGQAVKAARRRRIGKARLRRGLKYVITGRSVLKIDGVRVRALAPQDAAVSSMNTLLANLTVDADKVENALNSENNTSIALHVTACGTSVLLGGDVETGSRDLGWIAVVEDEDHDDLSKASIVKVPHHGSDNADYPPMWDKFVEHGSPMLVAPFWASDRPRRVDQQRLQDRGPLWQSATSSSRRTADGQVIEKQDAVTGGVQARRRDGDDWTIGVFGPAHLTNP